MTFLFSTKRKYDITEIYRLSDKVTQSDDKQFLFADTPDREYVFEKIGDMWQLSHTWAHYLLVKKGGIFNNSPFTPKRD